MKYNLYVRFDDGMLFRIPFDVIIELYNKHEGSEVENPPTHDLLEFLNSDSVEWKELRDHATFIPQPVEHDAAAELWGEGGYELHIEDAK